MHPTITQMLIQADHRELEVSAAHVRSAAAATPAGLPRRHTILAMAAIALSAVSLLAGCGGSRAAITDATPPVRGPVDVAQLFEGACASCHGPLGEGGLAGVPLNKPTTADRQLVIDAIRNGVGAMPASSDGMSDEQITALAEYVAGLR